MLLLLLLLLLLLRMTTMALLLSPYLMRFWLGDQQPVQENTAESLF